MHPVILLGVLAAGLFLWSKAKAAKETPELVPGGDDPWELVPVKAVGDAQFFDVFADAGAFGPHDRMRVLRYKEVLVNGEPRRVLVTEVGSVPEEVRERARDDFGLIAAPVAFQ